jgi:hypothetical protein
MGESIDVARVNVDFVVRWMKKAEDACLGTGRKDAAALWGDGIKAIRQSHLDGVRIGIEACIKRIGESFSFCEPGDVHLAGECVAALKKLSADKIVSDYVCPQCEESNDDDQV